MPVLDGSARPADLARVLGALSLAGCALGLVALALPLLPAADRQDMLLLALAVGASGAALLAGAERLSPWVVQAALALATVVVSADIALSPHSAVDDEMFYLLSACCALLFCRGWVAVIQLTLIPSGYGAALIVVGDPVGLTRWVLTVGVLTAVCVVVRALTERIRRHADVLAGAEAAEAELAYRAGHDPLTSLPNRALLLDRLEGALARLPRRGGEISLLFLDLDRFKLVNDSFGHQAGDRVVQAAAARLRALLRPDDTLARLGGDEFTVLCESQGPWTAERVADRIVAALAEPFEVAGRPVFLSASIGITRTTDPECDPGLLLAEADAAMYQAKELGGSRHAAYTPGLRLRGVERLEIDAGLRRALEGDELEVHYQPEVDLATGRITGVEALVRWRHPERGMLLPGHFIGAAEDSGLIVALGAHVLRRACADGRRWHDAGRPVRVGVNLSARQLADPALPRTVRDALADSGLPADALQLEITETALMEDADVAAIAALAELGVSVALDDFGVGFSSLSRFRALQPVEVVKIDRSFIAGLGGSEQDTAIIGGIVGIARRLGLTTVAEGIERPDQVAGARRIGCDLGQGFHFARPGPATAMDALLAAAAHGELTT